MIASLLPSDVTAVVTRGGRPDLAREAVERVAVVPGATPLFEEPGALERVTALAADFFQRHLAHAPATTSAG